MEPIQITLPEPGNTMACYDFDYAIQMLRQTIDFSEIERDFVPLRKWVNEVEQSAHELGVVDDRLNNPAGQEVLMRILQSVAAGLVSPKDALLLVCFWLNNGAIQNAPFSQQYQFA